MKHFTFPLLLAAALAISVPASASKKNNKKLYISTYSATIQVPETVETALDITLFRSLYAGYNSICLPFDLTADEVKNSFGDVRLEQLTGCKQNGNALELYFADCTEQGLKAGMPYLIYSPVKKSVWVKQNGVRSATNTPVPVTINEAGGNRVTFCGVFEKVQPVGQYGIPASQALEGEVKSILVRTDGSKFFLPTRCGLEWESQANGATELLIKHVATADALGNVTGISTLTAQNAPVDVYSLNGVLVKRQIRISEISRTLDKGIYVINGEKFLVK